MRITVLAGHGASTNILLNWLADNGCDDVEAIIEEPAPRLRMIRYRMKRLGVLATAGQLIFMSAVQPLLGKLGARRRRELLAEYGLRETAPLKTSRSHVPNINDRAVIDALQAREPQVVLVNGTRIIARKVLEAVPAPFVNIHAGITPAYRGVHGGYWALRNGDAGNFGATIHLVDPGVDTGAALVRQLAEPGKDDNFASYPLLQQAICMMPLLAILDRIERGEPLPAADETLGQADSKQWFHPTIWQYLSGLLRGIS